MVFSSIIFIFYFLPLFLLGYYLSGWRAGMLLAGSAAFYVWGEGAYVLLLLGLIGLNYAGTRWLDMTADTRRRTAILTALSIADFAVLDALMQLLERPAVAGHQSNSDFQVLGLGLLVELQHLAAGRTVHGEGLLHEHVQPLGDSVAELNPAESRGCGQDDDVPWLQAIHGLLIAVEPNELAVLRDIHLVFLLLLEAFKAVVELLLEHVGHGDELGGAALAGKGVVGGAGSAPPAADEGYLDEIAPRGVDMGEGHPRQSRSCGDAAGGFNKVAT